VPVPGPLPVPSPLPLPVVDCAMSAPSLGPPVLDEPGVNPPMHPVASTLLQKRVSASVVVFMRVSSAMRVPLEPGASTGGNFVVAA
jgi:hypothetical protein